MLFPVAGIELHPIIPVAIGASLGVLSGLFGVGGGFLATPLLIWCGVPPVSAVGSDLNQIVGASSSGAYLNARAGRAWYRVAACIAGGGLAASFGATRVVKLLRDSGDFNRYLGIGYAVLLTAVGAKMLLDFRKKSCSETEDAAEARPLWGWRNDLGAVAIGVLAGVLSAFLGVGGGVVVLPLMMFALRIPTRLAIGTSLLAVCAIAFGSTAFHAINNPPALAAGGLPAGGLAQACGFRLGAVDIVLAMLLMAGSVPGSWLGVWLGCRLKAKSLRGLFGLLVLAADAKMIHSVVTDTVGKKTTCPTGTVDCGEPAFAFVRDLAQGHPLLYGIGAAALALAVGLTLSLLVGRRIVCARSACPDGRGNSDRAERPGPNADPDAG